MSEALLITLFYDINNSVIQPHSTKEVLYSALYRAPFSLQQRKQFQRNDKEQLEASLQKYLLTDSLPYREQKMLEAWIVPRAKHHDGFWSRIKHHQKQAGNV